MTTVTVHYTDRTRKDYRSALPYAEVVRRTAAVIRSPRVRKVEVRRAG